MTTLLTVAGVEAASRDDVPLPPQRQVPLLGQSVGGTAEVGGKAGLPTGGSRQAHRVHQDGQG